MLLYFILGIIFIEYIMPILESIASILITKGELIKSKDSVKIAQYGKMIQEITDPDETNQSVIGFAIPTDEEEDEDG